jgi:chromosome segregation ATPase
LRQIEANEAQRHTNEWLLKKQELDQQLLEVSTNTNQLLTRYADNLEPESIQAAKTDIQELSQFDERIRRAKELLQNALNWLTQNPDLPDDVKQAALNDLNAEKSRIDAEEARVKELEDKLNDELRKQQELAAHYSSLSNQLSQLKTEAQTAKQEAVPDAQIHKLEEIQLRIQLLLEEVSLLERQIDPATTFLQSSIDLNALKTEAQQLQTSVEDGQKSANQQVHLLQIENDFDAVSSQLLGQIKEVESLLAKPDASIEELRRSNDILVSALPKLEEVEKLYDELDPEDETTQELRNKTADQLGKLNELFKNNQQSAQDRIDSIIGQQYDQVKL